MDRPTCVLVADNDADIYDACFLSVTHPYSSESEKTGYILAKAHGLRHMDCDGDYIKAVTGVLMVSGSRNSC